MFRSKKWCNERGDNVLPLILVVLVVIFLASGPAMCSPNKGQKEANDKLGEISTRLTRVEAEQTRQGQQLDIIVEITEKIWGGVQFLRNLELAKIVGGVLAFVGVSLCVV